MPKCSAAFGTQTSAPAGARGMVSKSVEGEESSPGYIHPHPAREG